jgi:hypothetical protein
MRVTKIKKQQAGTNTKGKTPVSNGTPRRPAKPSNVSPKNKSVHKDGFTITEIPKENTGAPVKQMAPVVPVSRGGENALAETQVPNTILPGVEAPVSELANQEPKDVLLEELDFDKMHADLDKFLAPLQGEVSHNSFAGVVEVLHLAGKGDTPPMNLILRKGATTTLGIGENHPPVTTTYSADPRDFPALPLAAPEVYARRKKETAIHARAMSQHGFLKRAPSGATKDAERQEPVQSASSSVLKGGR